MNAHLNILAKGKPEFTPLSDHLRHVSISAVRFANYFEVDQNIAQTGAIMHDIGKAHPVFQKQLKGDRPHKPFRHEIASMLFLPLVKEEHKEAVIEMVVAHHKSIINDSGKRGILDLDENEPDIFEYHLGPWEEWMPVALDILNEHGFEVRNITKKEAEEAFEEVIEYCENNHKSKQGPSIWKGLLMGADYFASALINNTEKHIPHLFQKPDLSFYDRKHELYPLSLYSADSPRKHTIVVASTGAGKTDYLLRRCKGRIFYTLPFQASINAMYNRLKDDLDKQNPNLDIRVLHAASSLIGKEEGDVETSLQELIGSGIKVLTPYQLAGIALGSKGYEALVGDIRGCDVILDEVHTYSDISQALVFKIVEVLNHLKCNIHIGTATMPTLLYQKILNLLGEDHTYEVKLTEAEQNTFDRHQVFKLNAWKDAKNIIAKAVEENQKVLIVCNRVNRAQEYFEKIERNYPDVSKMLIHSRFKRKDRNQKEKQLIGLGENGKPTGRFNTAKEACIVVSTQVVEVSLDISFDLMITEAAPLDAMIQRFGRVNRKRSRETIRQLKPVYVIAPPTYKKDALPYDPDILAKSFEVLPNGNCLHELDLQEKIDQVFPYIDFLSIEEHSKFKQSKGWSIDYLTHRGTSILIQLLEIDSVVCITKEDIGSYIDAGHDDRMQFEIPARYWAVKSFEKLDIGKQPYVIPNAAYSEEYGMQLELLKKNKAVDLTERML